MAFLLLGSRVWRPKALSAVSAPAAGFVCLVFMMQSYTARVANRRLLAGAGRRTRMLRRSPLAPRSQEQRQQARGGAPSRVVQLQEQPEEGIRTAQAREDQAAE